MSMQPLFYVVPYALLHPDPEVPDQWGLDFYMSSRSRPPGFDPTNSTAQLYNVLDAFWQVADGARHERSEDFVEAMCIVEVAVQTALRFCERSLFSAVVPAVDLPSYGTGYDQVSLVASSKGAASVVPFEVSMALTALATTFPGDDPVLRTKRLIHRVATAVKDRTESIVQHLLGQADPTVRYAVFKILHDLGELTLGAAPQGPQLMFTQRQGVLLQPMPYLT